MRRLRGFIELTFDLVEETTNLVERTHDAVVERSTRRIGSNGIVESGSKVVAGIQVAISGGVFQSIRLISGMTRITVNAAAAIAEAGFEQISESDDSNLAPPLASTRAETAIRYVDYLQSSLNGFWGDYLSRNRSGLDFGTSIRQHGRDVATTPEALTIAFPNATNKICVFVHGLAATERLWSLASQEHYGDPDITFGSQLQADLGLTPIYLRYNTGRHISENGRALATLLTEILDAYPVPIEEITLVGHSMGGLVARSAAHYARENEEPWVVRLHHVACIGSPHLGAPLEKTVSLLTGVLRNVEAAGTQVPAALLDSRSAGVKDLRYGYTVDEEWAGMDPDEMLADNRRNLPPVDGVAYYFLAATISRDPDHPLGQIVGDLLVRLPSASGEALEPTRRIPFADGAVFPGMSHLHIANHPVVYEALRDLLAA